MVLGEIRVIFEKILFLLLAIRHSPNHIFHSQSTSAQVWSAPAHLGVGVKPLVWMPKAATQISVK